MTMAQQTDAKSARVTAELLMNKSPTTANARQVALLNQLEIKLAELKILVTQITAAGGIVDAATATDLTNLIAAL